MGGCCSKDSTAQHTQPDTQPLIGKRAEASTKDSPQPPQKEGDVAKEFHQAVAMGNDSMAMYLIEENPDEDLINMKHSAVAPLHVAVKRKQYKMMKYLLDLHASPDTQEEFTGDTACHIAAREGDMTAIKLLLQYDADVYIENEEEQTAVFIAVQKNTKEDDEIASILEPDMLKLGHAQSVVARLNSFPVNTIKIDESAVDILGDVDELMPLTNSAWNEKMNTARLAGTVDDLFDDIQDDLTTRSLKIKELQCWLERKQHSPPYSWLRRWVVLKDKYLLWSDRQMTIKGEIDKKEKKRWNKCVSLYEVESVEGVKGKKERKFKVKVGTKEHIFRAKDKDESHEWIEQLKENLQWVKTSGLYNNTIRSVE